MTQETKTVLVRIAKEIGLEVAAIVGRRLVSLREELQQKPKNIEAPKDPQ